MTSYYSIIINIVKYFHGFKEILLLYYSDIAIFLEQTFKFLLTVFIVIKTIKLEVPRKTKLIKGPPRHETQRLAEATPDPLFLINNSRTEIGWMGQTNSKISLQHSSDPRSSELIRFMNYKQLDVTATPPSPPLLSIMI